MTKDILLAVCLQLVAVLVAGQQEYRAECTVWQNVTETLMYKNTVPMNCQKNNQCTGYDCTSEFTYRGPLTLQKDFTVDFCFGIAIHPCDQPLSMSFYVENPGDTETFQEKITKGSRVQLTGVHYTFSSLVSADGFVDVIMEPQQYQGNSYVKIGVDYKTRVSVMYSVNTWPSALAFKLMPETLVPVPPCDRRVKTELHVPGTCVKYAPPSITYPTGYTTLTPPTPGRNCTIAQASSCPNHEVCKASTSAAEGGHCVCAPGYYREFDMCVLHPDNKPILIKSCTLGEFGSCGSHQVCQLKNGSDGTCQCVKDYKWDGSVCVATAPAQELFIIGEPDFSKDDSGSSGSNIKIIIPVVAGVALAMLVIAVVVFLKYRRYKARYGQHSLLMAEDDDRNDGDDQMVEG